MEIKIRMATTADAREISHCKIEGWQAGYRGIVPDSVLDLLDVGVEAERRRSYLEDPTSEVINLVALKDHEIVGWLAFGPHRDPDLMPGGYEEIYSLYVLPTHWRSGVGHKLMQHTLDIFVEAKRSSTSLWVLEENVSGRTFYERMGLRPDGTRKPIGIGENRLVEVRYRILLTGHDTASLPGRLDGKGS